MKQLDYRGNKALHSVTPYDSQRNLNSKIADMVLELWSYPISRHLLDELTQHGPCQLIVLGKVVKHRERKK